MKSLNIRICNKYIVQSETDNYHFKFEEELEMENFCFNLKTKFETEKLRAALHGRNFRFN